MTRRLPIGAEVEPPRTAACVHFRVWAPNRKRVASSSTVAKRTRVGRRGRPSDAATSRPRSPARDGTRYQFRLDGDEHLFPDPASRFQPEGPHGPSQVVDPARFAWTDAGWRGGRCEARSSTRCTSARSRRKARGRRGRATARAGATSASRCSRSCRSPNSPAASAGATTASTSSRPTRLYGTPDDLRALRRSRARARLGVILDVVYNHFGPDGNYLPRVRDALFQRRAPERVGRRRSTSTDRTRPGARVLRSRTRATGSTSSTSTACASTRRSRSSTTRTSTSWPSSAARRARPPAGAHASSSPRTSRRTRAWCGRPSTAATASTRCGTTTSITRARGRAHRATARPTTPTIAARRRSSSPRAKYGFLYQGQCYPWQKQRRGTPALDLPPARFVTLPRRTTTRSRTPRAATAAASADQPRPLPRDDGAAAARAGNADAVSGAGVRRVDAVPVLRRPPAPSWRGRAQGTRRVPLAVPSIAAKPGRAARCPIRPIRDVSALRARSRRARQRTRGVRAASGPAGAAPRGCRLRAQRARLDGAVLDDAALVSLRYLRRPARRSAARRQPRRRRLHLDPIANRCSRPGGAVVWRTTLVERSRPLRRLGERPNCETTSRRLVVTGRRSALLLAPSDMHDGLSRSRDAIARAPMIRALAPSLLTREWIVRTGSAATRPAPSPASPRGVITDCSSPRSRIRSVA